MDVEIDFTIGTVSAPEVTDDDGYAYYWISGAPRKGTNETAKTVGQYAVKVVMDTANKALWKASLEGRGKASASQEFTLASKGATDDVTAVLLNASATHTTTSDVAVSHTIVVNFVADTQALTITFINGQTASSAAIGDDTNYYSSATGALFGLRPHTELTSEAFPDSSMYSSAAAKYYTITPSTVAEVDA